MRIAILSWAEHAVGFLLAAGHHAQRAHALTVQAEALGEAGGDEDVQASGHKLGDHGAVFGDAIAKTLVGHVQKGGQLARLNRGDRSTWSHWAGVMS